MWVQFLGREDPSEESTATHSSVLAQTFKPFMPELGTVTLKGFKPVFNLIGSIRSFIALHHWDYCEIFESCIRQINLD